MAITDIQISEELETSAPSIKYSGNEGPKSPQEIEMMMADVMLEEEYNKYVFDLLEIRPEATPMTIEEFRQMVIAEGQMSKGPILPSPEDPVNPFGPKPIGPPLPDRQMAAYGGIMGMDGRRKYGLGSLLKKTVRKLIPNEIAKVAEVAAPFIAPFNPLAAAVAGGLGSFDRTGSISGGLKSGLMNYGLGQAGRYLGGADFQRGINPLSGFTEGTTGTGALSKYFSKPTGSGGIKNLFADKTASTPALKESTYNALLDDEIGADNFIESMVPKAKDIVPKTNTGKILKTIKDFALDNKLLTGLAAGTLGATALMGNMEPEEIQDLQRGEGLDVEAIRAEVIEAYKDPTGEKLSALRVKYPFLSKRRNIDVSKLAYGGRIGKAEGGLMDLGGMEKDYRAEGGFVPIGREEKADDVPARLSVNEFVFTADAVRNAGGGDIDKGAEVMENMMKNLEAGGQVSEESQGMGGAQQMFEVSERLSEVV